VVPVETSFFAVVEKRYIQGCVRVAEKERKCWLEMKRKSLLDNMMVLL
jgi:hypothetical protein